MHRVASIPSPSESLLQLGPFTIHYYGLCIMLGIIAAFLIGDRRFVARGGSRGLFGDVALIAVPTGIIGGRLYHVLTSWDQYFGPGKEPIRALYIWQGGLGIWGAIALGALGAFLAFRRHPKRGTTSFALFADAIAPALLIAQAIGRFGNWFNKELFGRPLDAPWALEIPLRYRPVDYLQYETFHPTFLYEAIWCTCLALILINWKRLARLAPGSIFAIYVAGYSIVRLVIETIRIDESNLILGIRLNVWTAALLFAFALAQLRRLNRTEAS